jgi:hypothetical protein
VLFSQLEGYSCFKKFASVLGSSHPGAKHASSGRLTDVTLAIAREGDVIYGLVPTHGEDVSGDSPNCSAVKPCMLERLAEPVLRPEQFAPQPPFEQYFKESP